MLNQFRNAMRGAMAWVIGILIILAMAVVGVPALENFGSSAALRVGDQEISARALERELGNQIRQAQIASPNLTREAAMAAGAGEAAVQSLLARTLIESEARRIGLVAPDDVVRRYLLSIEGFADPATGRLNLDVVSAFMRNQGLTEQGLTDLVAGDLLRTQFIEAVDAGQTVPEELARFILLREFEIRDVRFASIPIGEESLTPPEEDIAAFYSENDADYQTAEYRSFQILSLNKDNVGEAIAINEDDVRALYEARLGAEADAETRTVRQVTLREGAEAFSAALAAGAGFEGAAKSAGAEIINLEERTRSAFLSDAVAEAAFAAEAGAVVGPVATPFGKVFTEIVSVSTRELPSFDDQRAALADELRAEEAEDLLFELAEAVEVARDEGASLAEAAEQLGLEIRTTSPSDRELFTKSGAIANIPEALAQAGFGLPEGEESDLIRLDDGYGFVAVLEVFPPETQPLEEVRDDIVRRLRENRADEIAAEMKARFQGLRADARTFQEAAEELGGTSELVTVRLGRDNDALPEHLRIKPFLQSLGELDVVPAPLAPELHIIEPSAVRYADAEAASAAIPILQAQLSQAIGAELRDAYFSAVEETVSIERNERQIARAFGIDQP